MKILQINATFYMDGIGNSVARFCEGILQQVVVV